MMKNENKYSEMIDILSHLHQYVPVTVTGTTSNPSASPDTPTTEKVHPVLFGGDQLTATRARGSQELLINSDTSTGRLCRLIPVAEDWHTSVTLLVVIIVCMYVYACYYKIGKLIVTVAIVLKFSNSCYRLYGRGCMTLGHILILALCTN